MLKTLLLIGILISVFFLKAERNQPPCALETIARDKKDVDQNETIVEEQDKVLVTVQKHIYSNTRKFPQRIPRVIYQTNQRDQIPFNMAYCVDSVQKYNHDYDYVFFNSTERRKFLNENMVPEVLVAYDKLTAKAYQADLFRYSLIYIMGGCYVDIGFVFINPMREIVRADDEFVSSVDSVYHNPTINPAFFCATPRHKIVQNTLNVALQHVLNSEYGQDSIDLTGPRRMGVGFKQYYYEVFSIKDIRIQTKVYPGNVRILDRVLEGDYDCMISYISDPATGLIIVYNKYPKYYLDMTWYTSTPYYGDLYDHCVLYQESHIIRRYKDQEYALQKLNETLRQGNPQ